MLAAWWCCVRSTYQGIVICYYGAYTIIYSTAFCNCLGYRERRIMACKTMLKYTSNTSDMTAATPYNASYAVQWPYIYTIFYLDHTSEASTNTLRTKLPIYVRCVMIAMSAHTALNAEKSKQF